MKVILLKKEDKLGDAGMVINVKDGYAINYLIPKGIAVSATDEQISIAKKKIAQKKVKTEEIKHKVEKVTEGLKSKKLKMAVKTSSGGRAFEAVDKADIEKLVADSFDGENVKVEIDLPQPIKEVGKYSLDAIIKYSDKEEKTEIILDVVSQ